MRALRLGLVSAVLGCAAGCGDNTGPGPFGALPRAADTTAASLGAPVSVARDRHGIAHIQAATVADGGFVQGYVTAHDRLPQMDILRRTGAGTLAELYGALDPAVIDSDLAMRVQQMTAFATQTWAALQASSAPEEVELATLLQRYADGVNAYAADLRAGAWTLDPQVLAGFDPAYFAAWTPVDSLVIVRLGAWQAAWTAPAEAEQTELYQQLRATFDASRPADAAAHARRGLSRDLFTLAPVGRRATLAGFPNVTEDTGSRADALAAAPARPVVPQAALDAARAVLAIAPGGPSTGNVFAVGPALADGSALLAADPHLALGNPSALYPVHLVFGAPDDAGAIDALGATIPGIPGLVLGSTGDLAWAGTPSAHDANDLYVETIAPCAADATAGCVTFAGAEVPLVTRTETIQIGALGAITSALTATYEVVPHHGPLLPALADHAVVPRTASTALSVRSTADAPTFELRALWRLAHAHDVHAGFAALADVTFGSQSFTFVDRAGHIGWSTNAAIPLRAPAATTWNPLTAQDGLAPFFALPGDGTAEWEGTLAARYIPAAIDPPAGYLVSANADPVGATFDDVGLLQPAVAGRPLYAGVAYDAGLRAERITSLLEAAAAAGPLTIADLARIQGDTHSSAGARLVPAILAALARLDAPEANPADVSPFVTALSAADRARLVTARALLTAWSGETPAATDPAASAAELTDAAASAVFAAWLHAFIVRCYIDELAAMHTSLFALEDRQLVRIVTRMLVTPDAFVTSPATQQPVVCDDMASASDDSCTVQILVALRDAMQYLETSDGFGTADIAQWRWGALHHLTLEPEVANPALALPAGDRGFPLAGDGFAVAGGDPGLADTDFAATTAPALRFLATAAPGAPIAVRLALPGGTIFDSRDPHYRDLLDGDYLGGTTFAAPYSTAEILADGESRWDFHP